MSENIDISNTLNKLSLLSNVDKKRQSVRCKNNTDKKKFKQACNNQDANCTGKVSNNVSKTRMIGQSAVLQKPKSQQNNNHRSYNGPTCKEEWSPYKFNVTNQDIEVCRQTAVKLNDVRESIKVDPVLFHNLNMLAFSSAQHMFDQQRNAFTFQEQLKQAEVIKWLSTKTDEERKEYFDSHYRSKVHL